MSFWRLPGKDKCSKHFNYSFCRLQFYADESFQGLEYRRWYFDTLQEDWLWNKYAVNQPLYRSYYGWTVHSFIQKVSTISLIMFTFSPFFRRSDREHHEFLMCPVSGCTSTFEASTVLDSHIAANQHQIPPSVPRTFNDIARLHLIETLQSTNIQSQQDTARTRLTHNTTSNAVFESTHYQHFSTPGWALRTCKHTTTMSEKKNLYWWAVDKLPKNSVEGYPWTSITTNTNPARQ